MITAARRVEIREFPDPTPSPDGVVVDIAFCGICGTDVGAYASGRPYTPAICGHEWTGTISAVGRNVERLREGDRVVVGVPPPCHECVACRAGHEDHCIVAVAFLHGRDPAAPAHGGFAPHIAVAAARVIVAHRALDDETLAQVEPVTVSLHAVDRSRLRSDDTVVVLGAGPVGLTTMQCALARGAARVVVVEPNAARRALAATLAPARHTGQIVTTAIDAAPDVVTEVTGGLGADIAFDCVGGSAALTSSVGLVRRGGSVCMIGFKNEATAIDAPTWLRNEITVTATIGYVHHEFTEAMDLIAEGAVVVDRLHSSTTRLEGLPQVFDDLANNRGDQLKVLVNPRW